MYWILFVMGLIASIVIAMIAGGLATPRAHTVSKSALLSAPVDEVWHTIRDRKSTRLNSSHLARSRMPSSA